jgi:hypothetical protein
MSDRVVFQPKPPQKEIENLAAALTEQRNPRSENLEKLSSRALVELFVEEEKFVQDALHGAIVDLSRAIEIVTESLRNGGRLFYVGAGSSGRIGVLDAAIPPLALRPCSFKGVAGGATSLSKREGSGRRGRGSVSGMENYRFDVLCWKYQRAQAFIDKPGGSRKVVDCKNNLLTCNPVGSGHRCRGGVQRARPQWMSTLRLTSPLNRNSYGSQD